MSVSKASKTPYRDNDNIDAISLLTTPDPDDNDVPYTDDASPSAPAPAPPDYWETTRYEDSAREIFEYTGLNNVEDHFAGFSSSKSVFQKECTYHISGEYVSVPTHQPQDADYFRRMIEYMSRQAPTPYIVVLGTHSEQQRDKDGKKKSVEVTDFRICVNLRNYLWPHFRVNDPTMMELHTVENGEKTWRGTVFPTRAPGAKGGIEVGETKPTLAEWSHRYIESTSKTQIFRLDRTVVGLDELRFRQRLTTWIRGTNYKGHLNIFFPVADRAVDIYSMSRLNEWRNTSWIRWFFYLTFLWIFAWPVLYLTTKRYKVVKAEWSFSRPHAGSRQYTTVSEDQWCEKFGPAVARLARDRYEGVAGDDVLNEVLARPETHRPTPAEFNTAAAGIGAAIGALRAGNSAAGQVNNILRFAGGSHDQVGWGFDT